MERDDFTNFAQAMLDYVGEYLSTIRERPPVPNVERGYLRPLLPAAAPQDPDKWQDVMEDIEKVIMPGVAHWQSPSYLAYTPIGNSYPAIVADILANALAGSGMTWIANPVSTELEIIMLDWLGKMLDLPSEFLSCSGGKGGGVIQSAASEATLLALLSAKGRALKTKQSPETSDYEIISKCVAYCSEIAHYSVERATVISGITLRRVPVDEKCRMTGESLRLAMEKDKAAGLIPLCVVATLGTSNICSFDVLSEIGPVCQKEGVWLHVDAAYSGSAFICPEYRYLMEGIQYADSFDFNPHKWMLVTFDCSTMWFKDPTWLTESYKVDPVYLKLDHILPTSYDPEAVIDYRHWQIPFGRRFRSLKLWFVMRLYGVKNLQAYIRKQIMLAHEFEEKVRGDDRFEIVGDVVMGLVCFRLKGSNEINENLQKRINASGKIHLVPSKVKETFFLRLLVCSRFTESSDICRAWEEVKLQADNALSG